jgi:hypothetical protein
MGVQECVQQVVLVMVSQAGRVDLQAAIRLCPGADERDLTAAIVFLLREGAIARRSPITAAAPHAVANGGGLFTTELGLSLLAQLT